MLYRENMSSRLSRILRRQFLGTDNGQRVSMQSVNNYVVTFSLIFQNFITLMIININRKTCLYIDFSLFQHKEDFLFELEMYHSGKDGILEDDKNKKRSQTSVCARYSKLMIIFSLSCLCYFIITFDSFHMVSVFSRCEKTLTRWKESLVTIQEKICTLDSVTCHSG